MPLKKKGLKISGLDQILLFYGWLGVGQNSVWPMSGSTGFPGSVRQAYRCALAGDEVNLKTLFPKACWRHPGLSRRGQDGTGSRTLLPAAI